jgi:rhodanese-related sulfurtransferase
LSLSPADELASHLAEIPRDVPVVTYCTMRHRGSSRSERAAALLRARGYAARALEGGIAGWQAAGNPVVTGADTARP